MSLIGGADRHRSGWYARRGVTMADPERADVTLNKLHQDLTGGFGEMRTGSAGSGRPTMRTLLHLKPGQKGTKQLLAQYGDRLICVRYRYDAQRKKRFKTVELLVAERDWEPPPPRFAASQIVGLRIAFAEAAARQHVKQAGAKWNPDRKLWEMPYQQAVALKLEARIVGEAASNGRCQP